MNLNKIYHGDCLEIMKQIQDKSINMIICDLPYGKTNQKWDIIINFEKLWFEYKRIIKDNGVIILFGKQPFTSLLIMSNLEMFGVKKTVFKADKMGYFPKGGSKLGVVLKGGKLKYNELLDFGKIDCIGGVSESSLLLKKAEVSVRQKRAFLKEFMNIDVDKKIETYYYDTLSPGSAITCWFKTGCGSAVGSQSIGERGKKSEVVGKECADKLLEVAKMHIEKE